MFIICRTTAVKEEGSKGGGGGGGDGEEGFKMIRPSLTF